MNTENYASLEASRRLVESGIVLETEVYWRQYVDTGWKLEQDTKWSKPKRTPLHCIPAPSMAEVWRELPETFKYYELYIEKLSDKTMAGYWSNKGIALVMKRSNNPTDALIDLLIWVRKEADHDQRSSVGKKDKTITGRS